jgi:hypothetical protein
VQSHHQGPTAFWVQYSDLQCPCLSIAGQESKDTGTGIRALKDGTLFLKEATSRFLGSFVYRCGLKSFETHAKQDWMLSEKYHFSCSLRLLIQKDTSLSHAQIHSDSVHTYLEGKLTLYTNLHALLTEELEQHWGTLYCSLGTGNRTPGQVEVLPSRLLLRVSPLATVSGLQQAYKNKFIWVPLTEDKVV